MWSVLHSQRLFRVEKSFAIDIRKEKNVLLSHCVMMLRCEGLAAGWSFFTWQGVLILENSVTTSHVVPWEVIPHVFMRGNTMDKYQKWGKNRCFIFTSASQDVRNRWEIFLWMAAAVLSQELFLLKIQTPSQLQSQSRANLKKPRHSECLLIITVFSAAQNGLVTHACWYAAESWC